MFLDLEILWWLKMIAFILALASVAIVFILITRPKPTVQGKDHTSGADWWKPYPEYDGSKEP